MKNPGVWILGAASDDDRMLGMEAWTINGQSYDGTKPWRFTAGGRYRILFDNRSDDEHPMHLHRHSFELKRVNDKPTRGLPSGAHQMLHRFYTLRCTEIGCPRVFLIECPSSRLLHGRRPCSMSSCSDTQVSCGSPNR